MIDYTLYLATDPHLLAGRDLVAVVEAAIAGGVTMIQLRDKTAPARELYETGRRLLAVTRRLGVPLIVNDRLDLMLALDADGVHLGAGDLPWEIARKLAPGKLIGGSVNTLADLRRAEAAGLDHVGLGAFRATATKTDAPTALGLKGVRRLVAATRLPCVAIGGITAADAAELARTGVAGLCVISAILAAPDPAAAARELRQLFTAART